MAPSTLAANHLYSIDNKSLFDPPLSLEGKKNLCEQKKF
jgi:hypothetical protein